MHHRLPLRTPSLALLAAAAIGCAPAAESPPAEGLAAAVAPGRGEDPGATTARKPAPPPADLWAAAAPLATGRYSHVAVLLSSGQVFVFGGRTAPGTYEHTAEIYDPVSGTWAAGASNPDLDVDEDAHATLLADGRVLVTTPGANGIYDPTADSWSQSALADTGRDMHSATLLPDGSVLLCGGVDLSVPTVFDSCLRYDPQTDTWDFTQNMSTPRWGQSATLLQDGRVLVAGGRNLVGNSLVPLDNAEIYDPTTGEWTEAAPLQEPRGEHAAVLLADGRVLVVGGWTSDLYSITGDVYDPATDTWSLTPVMSDFLRGLTATLTPSGHVLATGGYYSDTMYPNVDLYDPAADAWAPVPPLVTARALHTATLLPGGVLVTGGLTAFDAPALSSTEWYAFGTSAIGAACAFGLDCASGFCADGVCCDTACDSACDACAAAEGAAADGTCTPVSDVACDDANICTSDDVCQAGACVGVAVVCGGAGECEEVGTCDASSDGCPAPVPRADGTPCSGGVCADGVCVPGGGEGGGGGAGGSTGAAGGSGEEPEDDGGCGCRAAGRAAGSAQLWAGAALALLALGRGAALSGRGRAR